MRGRSAIAACVGAALLAAGCNPLAERRYVNEGAGVDLYRSDSAAQAELLNAYTDYICAQVGSGCGNWSTFVIAGMNDIDQRCDGFLTWLDGKRRDREPVLAELSAINTAVHAIMTVTGSSPQSLNIVTAAFGLASATYANWNSRLLISVEQSTVQAVVYKAQGDYREKVRDWVVPDRPTAVYLLRNYLRTCMPISIEAAINITTTLVQRNAGEQASRGLVVSNTRQPRSAVLRRSDMSIESGVVTSVLTNDGVRIGRFEQGLRDPQVIALQKYACLTQDGKFTEGLRNRILGRLESLNQKDQSNTDRLTARDGVMIRIDIQKGNKAC